MTDYINSARIPVRAIRWRCPGCGAMGDTTVKTNRRCTIVRRWCPDPDCRPGAEVRDALRAEAKRVGRKAAKPIDFSIAGTVTGRYACKPKIRMLNLPPRANTNAPKSMIDLTRHWIRPGASATPIEDTVAMGLDYGPIERRILARMKGSR